MFVVCLKGIYITISMDLIGVEVIIHFGFAGLRSYLFIGQVSQALKIFLMTMFIDGQKNRFRNCFSI